MPTDIQQVAAQADGRETKVCRFDFKALDTTESSPAARFSGYGAIFHNIDSALEIIAPGAFAEDLGEFIEEGFIGGINHDWMDPIAKVKSAHEDGRGLYVETDDIIDTTHGLDMAKLLRARVLQKLSIGYVVLRDERLGTMEKIEDYWRSHSYTPNALDLDRAKISMRGRKVWDNEAEREVTVKGVRLLRRVKLHEVSAVAVPANNLAGIMVVKSISRPISEESVKAEKASKKARPVPGRKFSDHSHEVVTTGREFLKRVEDRFDFWADAPREVGSKAGRVFSQANLNSITAVTAMMEEVCAQLRDIVARATSKPADEPATAAKADATPGEAKPAEAPAPAPAAGEPATPAVTTETPEAVEAVPAPVPGPAPSSLVLSELARFEATVAASMGVTVGS